MKRKIALAMCTVMCVATVLNGCGKADGGESAEVSSQNGTEETQKTEESSEGETEDNVHELSKYLNNSDGSIWYEVEMRYNSDGMVGKDSSVSSIDIIKDGKIACVSTKDTDITLGKIAQMSDDEIIEFAKKQHDANCEKVIEELESVDVYEEILNNVYYFIMTECSLSDDKKTFEVTGSEESLQRLVQDCNYIETEEMWKSGILPNLINQINEIAKEKAGEITEGENGIHDEYADLIYEELKPQIETSGYAEKVKQPFMDEIKSHQGDLQYYPYTFCLTTDNTGNSVQSEYFMFPYFDAFNINKPEDSVEGSNASVSNAPSAHYTDKRSYIDEFERAHLLVENASFRFDLSYDVSNQNYEVYDTHYAGYVNYSYEIPTYMLTKASVNESFTLDSIGTEGIYLDDFDGALQEIKSYSE